MASFEIAHFSILWSNLIAWGGTRTFFYMMEQFDSMRVLGHFALCLYLVHVPNSGGLSGSEDRGGGDNSIQFINFGRVGDKSFKEWRQKNRGWKGG